MIYHSLLRPIRFSLLLLLLILPSEATAVSPVPDTGQITSYTTTIGEDSDYAINPPFYTKLGQDGMELNDTATQEDGWIMIRDNVTGLIWEIKTDDDSIHDKDNTFAWCDTNPETNGGDPGTCGDGPDTEDLISTMNENEYGGFSDWRMPTRNELRTIIDYDAYNPAVNTDYFPNTVTSYYWSANTLAEGNGSGAWIMSFISGKGSIYSSKSNSFYVRAVRNHQGASGITSAAFVDNGDGTITDTITGSMWQKQDDGSYRNWLSAISYCEGLSLAGYDDWRLPNIKELASIVDLARFNPAIDPVFSDVKWWYWSSTSDANTPILARDMHFRSGGDGSYGKTANEFNVRAVRGGQLHLSGHLIISNPNQGDIWQVGETRTILWETQSISGNVSIMLSRDGGITFSETLSASTSNDGLFQWTVKLPGSYNCVLKITPLDDTSKATTQGLFTVSDICQGDFDNDIDIDGADLAVFVEQFGSNDCDVIPKCTGDFDNDFDVDEDDLEIFANNYGRNNCTLQ